MLVLELDIFSHMQFKMKWNFKIYCPSAWNKFGKIWNYSVTEFWWRP